MMKQHIVIVGPGRIGEALGSLLQATDTDISFLTREHYGDFCSDQFAPESAVAQVKACDVVLFCAGLFELNAEDARMFQANCGAIQQLADAFHARFPQAHLITFLDTRIGRALENEPLAIRAYLKAKQSLAQWTLEVAKAWGIETGTRVNAIAPGPVLPPPNRTHSEKAGACLTPRPTCEDVARAIRFLLETPSITGQILYVAAGQQLL